ncbi:hypothetical protein F5Y00DRAFT_272860 [Daldinia vernicosa]|uniref:uncharacterized protein n=1 Tax=Daldinia vernicosa TaxID=114800 RepID=UPI0020088665|nr:uncharacterized protein F5Y00DRAFT_272860 [Daldinia vernicosa]KAI0845558.1 hypothetical protein F5Y00DRAFT_272860 [Daldinia vernicosa]
MSRRGPWTNREDEMLKEIVEQQGALNWVKIAQRVQTRSPKQCRERYHQNLKPGLNHSPITPEEGILIENLVRSKGKRWAEIARALNNRSDNAVKNWWNGGMNRRQRLMRRAAENHYARVHGQNTHDESTPELSQVPASYHRHDTHHLHSRSGYSSGSLYGHHEYHEHHGQHGQHGQHGHHRHHEYEQHAIINEATNLSRPASASPYPSTYRSVDPSTYGPTSPYNYQSRRASSWENYSEFSGLPSPSASSTSPIELPESSTPFPWMSDHSLPYRDIHASSHSRETLPVLPPLRVRDSSSPSHEIQAPNPSHDSQPAREAVRLNRVQLPHINECFPGSYDLHGRRRTAPDTPPRHPARRPERHNSGSGSPSSQRVSPRLQRRSPLLQRRSPHLQRRSPPSQLKDKHRAVDPRMDLNFLTH